MTRSKVVTAQELVRELAADATYQARLAAQRTAAATLARECAADEAGLLIELASAGASATSVWDFVAEGGAPAAAVPLLVAHLERPHHPRIWEGLVRALSVRHAREDALASLVRHFDAETNPGRRWLLANALGSMAKFAEVAQLPGISEYRALFRSSRKPAHRHRKA